MQAYVRTTIKYLLLLILLCGAFQVRAATGVIDPLFHTAQVCETAACSISGTSPVNFGVFSTASASNATVTDTALTGYIWGQSFGWAVLNCANTTSGCSSTNGNFKVANTTSGHLSGYAWGEDAGWINFGPFSNNAAAPVVINSVGEFNGYAWAQNYGWIKFDCTPGFTSYCVKTDWRPTVTPSVCTDPQANNIGGALPCTFDTGGGGQLCIDPTASNYNGAAPCTFYVCSDRSDNDRDGLIDAADPGCHSDGNASNPSTYVRTDQSEDNTTACLPGDRRCEYCTIYTGDPLCNPPTYECSDGIDNSDPEDVLADRNDPGCYTNGVYSSTDDDETNPPTTCTGPSCMTTPTYECSDGIDNSDPEDVLADRNDPGCYTNGVYIPVDNDETDTATTCTGPSCVTTSTVCNEVNATNFGLPGPCVIPPGISCVGPSCGSGPVVTSVTQVAGPIGALIGLALTLANSLFANPITFSEIFLIPTRLWALLFVKRRYRPWGVVYDSVTKQPLDPAYVVLQDLQGNEITTCITDLDGRYGFLVPAGQYRMIANKTNYTFPSKKLAGKKDDDLYTDLYFNEIITIKEGEVIIKNIPMDPMNFDWNEFAKKDQNLMKFYSKRDLWISRISIILFYFGFMLTTIAVMVSPILYNIVIFGIYILLFIFQNTILKPRPFGTITYRGTPLPFAIIRVYSAENNREVVKKVSTQIGRYYCLVPNGSYYVTIEGKNADETYTLIYRSTVITVTNGYINKKFKV